MVSPLGGFVLSNRLGRSADCELIARCRPRSSIPAPARFPRARHRWHRCGPARSASSARRRIPRRSLAMRTMSVHCRTTSRTGVLTIGLPHGHVFQRLVGLMNCVAAVHREGHHADVEAAAVAAEAADSRACPARTDWASAAADSDRPSRPARSSRTTSPAACRAISPTIA